VKLRVSSHALPRPLDQRSLDWVEIQRVGQRIEQLAAPCHLSFCTRVPLCAVRLCRNTACPAEGAGAKTGSAQVSIFLQPVLSRSRATSLEAREGSKGLNVRTRLQPWILFLFPNHNATSVVSSQGMETTRALWSVAPSSCPIGPKMCRLADVSIHSRPLIWNVGMILDYLGRTRVATQVFLTGVSDTNRSAW
jgi:hypothetical protein